MSVRYLSLSIIKAILIGLILCASSCKSTPSKDDSFVSFVEVDDRGEKSYTSKELMIYPDSTGILNTADGNLSAYKVTTSTSGNYSLEGIAKYKAKNSPVIIDGEIPPALSVNYDPDTHRWKINGSGLNFRDIKHVRNSRRIYYNKAHVLHDFLARQTDPLDEMTADTETALEKQAPEVVISYANV